MMIAMVQDALQLSAVGNEMSMLFFPENNMLKTCDNYDSYLDKLLKINPKPDLKAIELLMSPMCAIFFGGWSVG